MSDQRIFEAKPGPGTALKIGEAPENKIEIDVTYKGSETPLIRVTATVHCGQKPEALLAATTIAVKVTSNWGDLNKLPRNAELPETVSWQTVSRGVQLKDLKDKKFSIGLSNFACSTPPGKAKIDLKIEQRDEKAQGFTTWWSSSAEIEKPKPVKPGLAYFTVSPSFVLHAGTTEVKLVILADGFESATLRRNNEEVPAWRREIKKGEPATLTDRPSITTVYRLEMIIAGESQTVDRTVQVISSGWNRLRLPQGYPAWLFVAPDWSGGGGRRLFGIFIDANNKATLHSSATGVDNWRQEEGDVPDKMQFSPGVVFKNKLWLIGGSSFDENEPGDQVWCYEENPDAKERRRWVRSGLNLKQIGARACHACVVVPVPDGQGELAEQLWILGGVDKGQCYQDVWTCDGEAWAEANTPAWAGRCRHATAAQQIGRGNEVSEVWLFGGFGTGHTPLSDLWVCRIAKDRKSSWSPDTLPDPLPGEGKAMALTAAPRAPAGENELTTGTGTPASENQQIIMLGTFLPSANSNVSVSRILRWQGRNRIWEAEEVGAGWERFEGSDFIMQAVAFNGFLFVWSLHPSLTNPPARRVFAPPRLNVLVSR
jgi:hypothetical protein